MRATAIGTLVAALATACTFPSVDYADAGLDAATDGQGACAAPASCATDATSCADSAVTKNDKHCLQQCQGEPGCAAQCAAELQSALAACAATCASCAAPSCNGAATNCQALVGL